MVAHTFHSVREKRNEFFFALEDTFAMCSQNQFPQILDGETNVEISFPNCGW